MPMKLMLNFSRSFNVYNLDSMELTHGPIFERLCEFFKSGGFSYEFTLVNVKVNTVSSSNFLPSKHLFQIPLQPNLVDCGLYVIHAPLVFLQAPDSYVAKYGNLRTGEVVDPVGLRIDWLNHLVAPMRLLFVDILKMFVVPS